MQEPLSAMTEESNLVKVDRKAGAWTETPAQWKPNEVPSRAAQVNAYQVQSSEPESHR